MKSQRERNSGPSPAIRRVAAVLALFLGAVLAASAQSFTLEVVDQAGLPLTVGYRWLLQEDTTYDIVAGVSADLSHGFHRSYSPPVATGDQSSGPIVVPDPAKRYFLSVLPDERYTMSGAPVPANVAAGTRITVNVHAHPVPTARISVRVFHDNFPLNNIEDQPAEQGLAGFKIMLEDAGGRYGISAGAMMMDAFGNPLGTVYGADGNIVKMGDGVITSDANGDALIENLAPGKYGVSVVPPSGQGWIQTSTIEGTKINDAWVKPDEPPFFVEFGPPGVHAFFGFVQPTKDATFFTGTATITGQAVWVHNSRPPDFTFQPGAPVPGAWVGLNSAPAGTGRAVYAAPADEDGYFTISNVPAGVYELVVWDENLDVIFDARDVTVAAGATLNLKAPSEGGQGPLMVFDWFARMEHIVFEDKDQDGFRDPGEKGIPEQAVNLRFRDGSLYQSMPTDLEGFVPFDEVFPFFNWLVAEVDYTRFKATGATIIVDAGGAIPPDAGWAMPSRGILRPQPQYQADATGRVPVDPLTGAPTTPPLINPNTGNNLSRTETGQVLLEGFQAFLGQTNIVEWGKAPYAPGENGGISGIVYYASTRAEHDPALAVGEPWEPGVPRVQVNLYRAAKNQPTALGDLNANGIIDNLDDFAIFDLNLSGAIELADVDNHPFGWLGGTAADKGPEDVDQNANGTFDQGDALQVVWSDSWDDNLPAGAQGDNGPGFRQLDAFDGLRNFNQVRPAVFDGGYAFNDIPAGIYIVEAKLPPGYQFVKEEDKNVDFGDEYQGVNLPVNGNPAMPMGAPDNVALPQDPLDKRPILVGDLRPVPAELSLFPGIPAPFAGELRPLSDRKQVKLNDGQNAAADFFLFTYVPVAGHIVGFVLDDLSNEFDPNAPQFGEKYSPPFLPLSVRDWTGKVISYSLTDRYGAYNILVPSTYTANRPAPSGFSPNMLTVVINDPTHPSVPANIQYSQFSYTFNYMPGTTTYLDTPVVPIAAFAGPDQFPVDVEFEDGTPVIKQVDGGPYVASAGQSITIRSMGSAVQVPNPDYDGVTDLRRTIPRDYGFGDTIGTVTIGGVRLTGVSWGSDLITGTVAAGTTTGQLVVTRSNGKASTLGVTVTVGPLGNGPTGLPRQVITVDAALGQTIQAAVDAANPGDLILVAPGTYREMVILYEPVQLQGWGAGATFINAVQVPSEKIINWRTYIHQLWTEGKFDLLPAQTILFTGLEPKLAPVEGAGVSVYARNTTPANGGFGLGAQARIDGFTVEGASTGGGIFANGYVRYLEVSNNRIRQNSGNQGGGVTIGHPALTLLDANGVIFYQDAENDYVRIHNNQIVSNGGLGGAGGGVSLYTGADNYEVTDNLIAGNFTEGEGAGIGHLGRSNGGLIARNRILFNQSFFQQTTVSGGGIFLGGGAALNLGGLTEGTGSVTVDANLIQGNLAGAGDGGGIKVIWSLPADLVRIANNFIVNNVAGLAGGGIALQDAASVQIVHNTIARNDSTATAGAAFINLNLTAALPAGIAARAPLPSQLVLDSNIIWENRAFHFEISSPTVYGLVLDGFRDLGVLPAGTGTLVPTNSILTGAAVPFTAPYFNVGRRSVIIFPPTAPLAMPAFDEGGNFIDVRYGPLTAVGSNYHLSSAFGGGTPGQTDVDGDLDNGTAYAGADRFVASSNLVPVAVKDSYELTLPANGRPAPYWVSAPGVLANDYDPDNSGTLSATLLSLTLPAGGTGTLQFNLTTRPANIPVSFVPGPGSFIFTAGQRFEGLVTFTYLLSDGQRASVGTATINVVNPRANAAPAPTAQPINVLPYTGGNPPTVGTTRVLPNDPNVGDTHTFAFVNYQDPNPRNGSATLSAGGTVSYTPDPNFTGTDVVIVRVTDQLGRGANVRIDVIVSLSLAPTQNLQVQMPPDLDGLDTDGDGDPANDNVYVLLGAGDGFSTMADGYQQYIFSFSNLSNLLASAVPTGDPNVKTVPLDRIMEQGMLGANFPAPTLKIKEGQRLYLNLANVGMALRPDLFDPHTVHWHGFPQAAPVFDGVPDASLSINMSANYTFFYDVVFPGTYMYHCHVEATEHMQMGMLGNLFVTPKQDSQLSLYPKNPLTGALYAGFAYNDGDGTTGYDVDYPIQIAGFDSVFHDASLTVQPLPFALMKDRYPMLNGRGYPDTVAQGSLVPPEANTYVEATVLAETPRNPNRFFIDGLMLADTVGAYNGLDLVFSQNTPTVALRGVSRRIRTYDFVQENNVPLARITLESPLPVRPNAGDSFSIGKASQNVSSRIVATKGQKILLRISSLDVTRYYTLASALPMQIVGLNARLLRGPDPDGAGPLKGSNLYYTTNSVTLGGGESVDAIVDTTNVAPGTYLLYTSNLNYLSNNQEDFGGMMTEIVVNP